jgi:hypothetical protein
VFLKLHFLQYLLLSSLAYLFFYAVIEEGEVRNLRLTESVHVSTSKTYNKLQGFAASHMK